MITVRFFGTLRLDARCPGLELEADRVETLLQKLAETLSVEENRLRGSVILVNGVNILQLKKWKTRLQSGDVVQFFAPSGGG